MRTYIQSRGETGRKAAVNAHYTDRHGVYSSVQYNMLRVSADTVSIRQSKKYVSL